MTPDGKIMMRAFAMAPHSLSHTEKMDWIADFFLKERAKEKLAAIEPIGRTMAWHGPPTAFGNGESIVVRSYDELPAESSGDRHRYWHAVEPVYALSQIARLLK